MNDYLFYITERDMALFYFFFYDNKYTYSWLNQTCKIKKIYQILTFLIVKLLCLKMILSI